MFGKVVPKPKADARHLMQYRSYGKLKTINNVNYFNFFHFIIAIDYSVLNSVNFTDNLDIITVRHEI